MVFSRGHGLRQWEARRDPVVRISALAHRFRGEDQKKESLFRNLRPCHDVYSYFRPRTQVYLRLVGHKQYFWGHRPRNALQWHWASGPVTLFWATIFARWGTIFAWGAQAVIWGALPEWFPVGRACTLHLCKPHSDAIIQKSASKISHSEKV